MVKVGGVWMPTNATWYDLHLADPPVIDNVTWTGKLTPTTPITVSGTGDATDTITIFWDATHVVGTGTVGADDSWSIVVFVPVGWHDITATETVNELPHVGLTSDQSCDVDVTVYPDPPRITFTSIPGPTTSSTPVTVSGTGDVGDSISLYDGSHYIGGATVGAAGTWALTLNFGVGTHSLSATQTWSHSLTSNASPSATVTVYAPPPAPSIATPPAGSLSQVAVSGSGVSGDTVTLYDGATVVGSALVASGSWSLTVTLSIGTHTLTAKQTDPNSGFTGNASAGAVEHVYAQPAAPTIGSVSTPAVTKTSSPVTVTGTGIAGDKITLYDGTTQIGTVTVASNGNWSLTVQLAVGIHSLTATQTLVAAVTSGASNAWSVTVYPPPPAAPSISAPASATTSTSVTLSGSGVAGDTVTLYDGANVIGTALVAANGSWTLTPTALSLTAHTFSATQTDPTWGFTSVKSTTVTVTIYAPPPTPVIARLSSRSRATASRTSPSAAPASRATRSRSTTAPPPSAPSRSRATAPGR